MGICCFSLSSVVNTVNGDGSYVGFITIDVPIDTVSERYLRRSLAGAEEDGAVLIVTNLDTLGGLLGSTRDTVESILNSNVPVAVAVSAPLGKTEKIVVISGGGGGDSGGTAASRLTRDVTSIMAELPSVVEILTGIDISSTLKNLTAFKTENGSDGNQQMPESESDETPLN